MRTDLHTQLVDTRDLVEGMRALTVSAGDDGLIHLTGTLLDRLLRTIEEGIDGCIDTLEDAAEKAAMRRGSAHETDAESRSVD